MTDPARRRRRLHSLLGTVALAAAGWAALGPVGVLFALLLVLPVMAARHDNHTGSLLLLAVLLVVAVLILFGLLAAMVVMRG